VPPCSRCAGRDGAHSGARDGSRDLLGVRDLKVHFPIRAACSADHRPGARGRRRDALDIAAGRTLALVGESGCGKTTVGKAILQPDRAERRQRVGSAVTDIGATVGFALRARRARACR
jgi:peptide/nickel transport system ATP-binding protein